MFGEGEPVPLLSDERVPSCRCAQVGSDDTSCAIDADQAEVSEILQLAAKLQTLDFQQLRDQVLVVVGEPAEQGDQTHQVQELWATRAALSGHDHVEGVVGVAGQHAGAGDHRQPALVDCDFVCDQCDLRVAFREGDNMFDGAGIGQRRLGGAYQVADRLAGHGFKLDPSDLGVIDDGCVRARGTQGCVKAGSRDQQEPGLACPSIQDGQQGVEVASAVSVVDDQQQRVSAGELRMQTV